MVSFEIFLNNALEFKKTLPVWGKWIEIPLKLQESFFRDKKLKSMRAGERMLSHLINVLIQTFVASSWQLIFDKWWLPNEVVKTWSLSQKSSLHFGKTLWVCRLQRIVKKYMVFPPLGNAKSVLLYHKDILFASTKNYPNFPAQQGVLRLQAILSLAV